MTTEQMGVHLVALARARRHLEHAGNELSTVYDEIAHLRPHDLDDDDRKALLGFCEVVRSVDRHAQELADFEAFMVDRTERGLDPLPDQPLTLRFPEGGAS